MMCWCLNDASRSRPIYQNGAFADCSKLCDLLRKMHQAPPSIEKQFGPFCFWYRLHCFGLLQVVWMTQLFLSSKFISLVLKSGKWGRHSDL